MPLGCPSIRPLAVPRPPPPVSCSALALRPACHGPSGMFPGQGGPRGAPIRSANRSLPRRSASPGRDRRRVHRRLVRPRLARLPTRPPHLRCFQADPLVRPALQTAILCAPAVPASMPAIPPPPAVLLPACSPRFRIHILRWAAGAAREDADFAIGSAGAAGPAGTRAHTKRRRRKGAEDASASAGNSHWKPGRIRAPWPGQP